MSDPDGQHHSQYDAASADFMLAHAADVVRATGFAARHIILIGGLVPTLLVPVLDPGMEPHVGTADVDLCLSMALIEGDTATYGRIEAELKALGFEVGDASFRWVRGGDVPMTVEFFCASGPARPPGSAWRPKAAENPTAKHNMGSSLSALALEAGDIISADAVLVEREVALPNSKGTITISLNVTGPVAFLVAKTQALHERNKPKDAYDIVWLIENWPEGPAAAAAAFRERPAFSRPEVAETFDRLRAAFSRTNSVGSRSFARFLGANVDEEALLERRAVGALQEFFDGID